MSFPLIFIELLLSHILPFTLTIVANLLVLAHAYHVACLLRTSKCFYRWICPFVLLVPSWKTSQHNVPKFALANFCLPLLRLLLSHLWWSWCLFWSTGSRASIASLNQLRCLLLSVPYIILPTSVKAEPSFLVCCSILSSNISDPILKNPTYRTKIEIWLLVMGTSIFAECIGSWDAMITCTIVQLWMLTQKF